MNRDRLTDIMLHVSSTLAREVRWFLLNYALLNAEWFGFGIVWGVVQVASASDHSIPGYRGSGVEQAFWWAVGAMFFGPLLFGLPLLTAGLAVWRVAIRVTRRPRLTAYLLVAVIVLVAAIALPRTRFLELALLGALPMFVYASVVRVPFLGSNDG